MIIRKLLKKKVFTGIVLVLLTMVMTVTGTLCYGSKLAQAAEGDSEDSAILEVYKWTRIHNEFEIPVNTRINIVMVKSNNLQYFTLGGRENYGEYDEEYKHYHDKEDLVYFRMTSCASHPELQFTLDSFYTYNAYSWWSCTRYNNIQMDLYCGDGTRIVADDDDHGDSCLEYGGGFADGENSWRYDCINGSFRFQHWSKYYDEYMGYNGQYIFCENTSHDPGWDNMDGFYLYRIDKVKFTCLNGNITVQDGQVLNIETGWVMRPDTVLTIEPGGLVNVNGDFWCNGNIKNYGTMVLREGSNMYSFLIENGKNYGGKACAIDLYGGEHEIVRKQDGTKVNGEGLLLIMKDAFLMTSAYADAMDMYGSATFVNFGTAVFHNGIRIEKGQESGNKKSLSTATVMNYGTLGFGASVDPAAMAAAVTYVKTDRSNTSLTVTSPKNAYNRWNIECGRAGEHETVVEIVNNYVVNSDGKTGKVLPKEKESNKSGDELFRYVNEGEGAFIASTCTNRLDFVATFGMGERKSEPYYKNDYSNVYALNIGTGYSAGSDLQYIGVRYVGQDSVERTEYVFPAYGWLTTSYERAQALLGGTSLAQEKQNILAQYGVRMSQEATDKGLGQNTNEDFLFRTPVPIKEVLGIDFMNGNQEWTCKNISLYEVQKVENVDMKGYISSNRFIDYSGTRIFLWERVTEANIGTNKLFRCRMNVSADNKFEIIDGVYARSWTTSDRPDHIDLATQDETFTKIMGTAAGNLTLTAKPVVKASTKSQTIAIDIGSIAGAGLSGFVQNYDSCISLDGKTKKVLKGSELVSVANSNAGSDGFDSGIGSYKECLTLNVSYYDTNNVYNELHIPVLYSTLCYLCKEAKMGGEYVYGLGQASDTLAFKFTLPGYDRDLRLSLNYGTENATKMCGITYDDAFKHRAVNPDGSISIISIQLYDQMPEFYVGQDLRLHVNKIGTPTKYYTAPTKLGTKVLYDDFGQAVFDLKTLLHDYDKSASLTPRSTGEMYMVEMTVSVPSRKRTYVTLGYTQQNGKETVTNAYCVQDEVEAYYGLWSAYKGGAYELNAKPGGTFYFLVDAKTASKFEYAVVRVEGVKGESDMQISGFRIYQIGNEEQATGSAAYEFDPRNKITAYEDIAPGCYSYWNVKRSVSRSTIFVDYGEEKLVRSGTQEKISFATCSSTIENENEVDWADYEEYMSYSSTQQDMGYTKVRNVYTVTVKVAPDSDVANSDSGSKNQFYFQLLYDNGKSTGYVLANQQLMSDGFRSGYEETFKIYSNYDYGDICGVRVIPDDQQEGSNVFDKLCVEYITISKQTNSGIARTWRCDINDWVGIDYSDSAAADTVKGKQGRTEAEMARTYAVTEKGYDIILVVEFETGDYNTINSYYQVSTAKPIQCALKYDITYTNQEGQICLASGDAAQAMYDYMDYDPVTKVSWTGKDVIAIDSNTMMKPNTKNRFMVALDNPRSINSITLTANGDMESAYTWKLGKVNVYRIIGGTGALYFDSARTFCRRYDMTLLAVSNNADFKTTIIPVDGRSQSLSVDFDLDQDNVIEIDTDTGKWTSTAGKLPESRFDTLGVFVHMDPEMGKKTAEYDMKMEVTYKYDSSELADATSTKTVEQMTHSDDVSIFCAKISTNGFKELSSIKLIPVNKGGGKELDPNAGTYGDYAIIIQERSGVIVDVFFVDLRTGGNVFDISSSVNKTFGNIQSKNPMDTGSSQKIVMSFGDFGSHGIVPHRDAQTGEYNDIGFAINYTIKGDPTNTTYASPNYFLSDFANNQAINPHQQIEIPMNIEELGEIKNIKFFAQGSLGEVSAKDGIDNRMILEGLWLNVTDKTKPRGGSETVSTARFIADDMSAEPFYITSRSRTLGLNSCSEDDVNRHVAALAQINLHTAASEAGVDAGCQTPIWGKISWVESNGTERSIIMNDINDYVQSGNFNSGSTATLNVYMYDFYKLHSISFEPYDDQAAASTWRLESLDGKIIRNDTDTETIIDTKVINKTITESGELYEDGADRSKTATAINLANIAFAANTQYWYKSADDIYNYLKAVPGILDDKGVRDTSIDRVLYGYSEGSSAADYAVKPIGIKIPAENTNSKYDGDIKITAGTAVVLETVADKGDITLSDKSKFVKGSFGDITTEISEMASDGTWVKADASSYELICDKQNTQSSGNSEGVEITSKITFIPANSSTTNEKHYLLEIISEEFPEKRMTLHVIVDKNAIELLNADVAAKQAADEAERKQKEEEEQRKAEEERQQIFEGDNDYENEGGTEGGTEGGNETGSETGSET